MHSTHTRHECGSSAGLDWTKTKEHDMSAESPEQCDSMNAHAPHGRCPGARGAFTDEFPADDCCPHAAADHEPEEGSTRPVGCQIAACDCRNDAIGVKA